MYADDLKIYDTIQRTDNAVRLQDDIKRFETE